MVPLTLGTTLALRIHSSLLSLAGTARNILILIMREEPLLRSRWQEWIVKRIRRGTVLGFTLFEGKGLMEDQIVGLRAQEKDQAVTMPHVSMKEVRLNYRRHIRRPYTYYSAIIKVSRITNPDTIIIVEYSKPTGPVE